MRLEYKPAHLSDRIYLDIWASDGKESLAIELKYKTRGARFVVAGETFELLNHGANPPGRYDFLKDVERLERVVEGRNDITGCAIWLTNDSMYWTDSGREVAIDLDFRLHTSRTISGKLDWGPNCGPGTKKNREKPIVLRGAYKMDWHDYSQVGRESRGRFRYQVVRVTEAQCIPGHHP